MKRILFFIPTLSGGGAEKVLVNLVNNMDSQKYSITVMTLFNVGVNISYLNENIEYKYVFNRLLRGNKYFLKLFSPRWLFNYMIKDDFDIIVSYLQGPTARIVSGCNNKETKIVNWIHNEVHDIKKLSSSYRNEKETRRCFEKYNATVFVAETAKHALQNILPNLKTNLKVLYNTVETDMIKELSTETIEDIKFGVKKTNLISVGRFASQKGFERLLEIIAKLVHEDKVDVHLYLLGKGELEAKYKEIMFNKKISDHVTILGYKENPYKYVKNSDLFVCSSYHEGFSTAVTESLIVGTPVITTLCSGMKEMLGENGEYGVIVENTDEDLYLGLKSLLNNTKEMSRLKTKAEERGKYFNKYNTVGAVEEFFDSL
jgi:glycosyltransferase involved in cell wall biosynthesis